MKAEEYRIHNADDETFGAAETMSASARASLVNRTHRVVRQRARAMQASRATIRGLFLPLVLCSTLMLTLVFAVWMLLDQYDLVSSELPPSIHHFFLLLLWFLPVSAGLVAMVWFGRSLNHENAGGGAMNGLWNGNAMGSSTNAGGNEELAIIPRWSIFLAIVVFAATQYLVHGILPHHRPEMLPMRLLMGYSMGTAVASYVLLVGYVSRDVKRRNMPAGLWLLIVILMPGGIGGVVYFLLRQPILGRCPHCSTEMSSTNHFCSQCQFQMAPVCGRCFRGVQMTDVYCVQCGHDLAEDHSPARLRAYSD